jgi:hypothetical protein
MDAFESLMAEVMASAGRFGHREHLHLAWLAVRRHGPADAADLIGDGIRRTARYAGAPQKYHATMTGAWVRIVAHHVPGGPDDFADFLERYPRLLDKRLLAGHYTSGRLASPEARQSCLDPDLAPLPLT